ncbi:MAG: hypothetical protein HGB28_05280 [Oscillochloris sp.]|nr:hypothetical protein [Oscillochloris sp.]
MYFGNRRIRSAGRASGSVEVTLPPQLHGLQEITCRLMLRDGTHPEIVLQPDLSTAHTLLIQLWQKLRIGLVNIGEIGDFDPSTFTLALFPPRHWQQRPPLAYADALTVLHKTTTDESHEALARLTGYMAIAAGQRLGLSEALALAFGDTIAYLLTGIAILAGTEFERGLATRLFWEQRTPAPLANSLLDDLVWQQAGPGLSRVWEQFDAWQSAPQSHTAARQNWYRALTVEMGSV